MFLLFSLEHHWPICLPWTSLALLLILYSHGFLLTSLGFPGSVTSYSSLGFMGLPSIPYSLRLHCFELAAVHSYFFSYHTLPMSLLFAISLFSGSFEPICFLNAHLFISWTCDSLFLPIGLYVFFFSISCRFLFGLCCLVGLPPFHLGFTKKKTLNNSYNG